MGKKKYLDSSLLDRAICFAVKAHANTERKGKGFPYIVHPLEAVVIVSTITSDQELLAAAALHDTLEDTDTTYEQLEHEFGKRVADLVAHESDVKLEGDASATWHLRKQIAIEHLEEAPIDAKIVALGDKLSNMRIIARDYAKIGDNISEFINDANYVQPVFGFLLCMAHASHCLRLPYFTLIKKCWAKSPTYSCCVIIIAKAVT